MRSGRRPLQNRVTPFGDVVAIAQRGLFIGNRGIIHDPATKTLLGRRWTTQGVARLCSRLRGAAPRGDGRPQLDRAFLSRRSGGARRRAPPVLLLPPRAAEAFRTAWGKAKGGKAPLAPEMDAILHEERLDRGRKRVHAIPGPIAELPDGTVIAVVGEAYTIVRGRAFRWSERGYQVERQIPLADGLLTPPSTLLAIRRKPRRSRANLRPPSPFASVIDRLLKNQNLLENRNNLRPSSPHLVVGRRPGTAPQFCGSKVHGHREPRTARRSAAAASRGPRPGASRAGWRLRQSHHRLQQAIAVLSSAGDASRPHHALFFRPQNRGAVIQALPAAS